MFRLCLAGVGGCVHPDELESRISSRQASEWMAFAALEPFGERNRDLSIGWLTSVLANVYRNVKKKKEPFIPEDFMPDTFEAKLARIEEKKRAGTNIVVDVFRTLRDSFRRKKKGGK